MIQNYIYSNKLLGFYFRACKFTGTNILLAYKHRKDWQNDNLVPNVLTDWVTVVCGYIIPVNSMFSILSSLYYTGSAHALRKLDASGDVHIQYGRIQLSNHKITPVLSLTASVDLCSYYDTLLLDCCNFS